ncbi:hypothetical protein [Shewanella sp.]|uniref:hypothetical protein n=1 Tax=Shewanella sp. TaxID=50422 RepID=UPI003F66BCF3
MIDEKAVMATKAKCMIMAEKLIDLGALPPTITVEFTLWGNRRHLTSGFISFSLAVKTRRIP